MALFQKKKDKKEKKKIHCDVCGKELSYFTDFQVKDGHICRECAKETKLSVKELFFTPLDTIKEMLVWDYLSKEPPVRSDHDEDLAVNFMTKWWDKSNEYTDAFFNAYQAAAKEELFERKIDGYKKAIELFDKAREWHYKKSRGGKIFFQDTWEYCHNSKIKCFSYRDDMVASLKYAEDVYYNVIPGIMKAINDGNGELLQKDIYPHLPDTPRGTVQSIIRHLEREGRISREKKGATYKLSLIQND